MKISPEAWPGCPAGLTGRCIRSDGAAMGGPSRSWTEGFFRPPGFPVFLGEKPG